MKTLISILFTIGLLNLTVQAQQPVTYHVHVMATNGKVVNKTFASAEALNEDAELQSLQVGGMEDKKFAFTPDESRHKAILVEELSATGEQLRFLFQAWDSEAAKEVQKSASTKHSSAKSPIPLTAKPAEKPVAAPTAAIPPKGFEEEVLQELLKDGLIQNKTNVSLELTKHNFLVNQQKQPENIREKYVKLIEAIKGEKLRDNFQFYYSVE